MSNISINKELWLKPYIYTNQCPDWSCPTCKIGHLTIRKEDIISEETKDSKLNQSDPEWEPYWIASRFSAILRCNNSKCRDVVTTCGRGGTEEIMIEVEDGYSSESSDYFVPEYFTPPLNIFRVDDACPDIVRKEIIASFSLFFTDTNSCSNKIRVAVELILDENKIPKTKTIKSKRRRLNLHERIVKFGMSHPNVANALLAIKWIGNAGSHHDKVEKQDLLDAYDILVYALDEIYIGRRKEIERIIGMINKSKAPRSKKKKQ